MAGLLDFLSIAGNISNPLGVAQRGLLSQIAPPILDYFKNQPQSPQYDSMFGLTSSQPTMPSPAATPYPQGTDPMTAGGYSFPQAGDPMTAGGYPQGGPSSVSSPLPNPIAVGDYQMPRVGDPSAFVPQQSPTDVSAQSRQAPQQPMALPPAFGRGASGAGFLDRVNAGLQSIGGGGSVIGALTGNYTDPASTASRYQNVTLQALVQRGVDPATAVAAITNPEIMKALLPQLMPPQKFEKVGPGESLYSVGGAGNAGKATPIVSGGPEKPPAGYQYVDPKDPSKGLAAIPGGPATHLPAETAGRIAMMETAAAELPNARKTLMEGRGPRGAGVGNTFNSAVGLGSYARAERTVTLAIEGALRAMTGAAAPETEVSRYKNLFMPSPLDSPETATQKLNQLDDFIANAKRMVTQGRGPAGPSGRASDPLGIR